MACILERDGSTGFYWCSKRNRKAKQDSKGRTSGQQKGVNCKATPLARYLAKKGRSYKHSDYSNWCDWADKVNKKG